MSLLLLNRTQLANQTPFNNSTNGFVATDVQAAIEEARRAARFTLILGYDSVIPNNAIVGYNRANENTPVLVPNNCELKDATFSNKLATADGRFDFYINDETVPANLFYQWTITNQQYSFVQNINKQFAAGDRIRIRFIDTGDNPDDLQLVLFFNIL